MRAFLLAAVAVGFMGTASMAQTSGGEYELVLWNSIFHGPVSGANNPNLVLHLEHRDGQWGRVLGYAQSFGNALHMGIVDKGEADAQGVRLKLSVMVNGDQWNRGTWRGVYDVNLKRDSGGALEGTYEGTFNACKVSGRATAKMVPLAPVAKDFKPVEPGEHPRVLFRRSEIPALKQRLATPLGKAYVARAEKSGDAINLGVLYALTGEKRYAEQAQAIVRKYLADCDSEFLTEKGAGSGGFGHSLVASALAYDLCYDAWSAECKAQLERTMYATLPRLVRYCMVTSHANTHPCSNYFGPGHGSPAIASLALWGDKGDGLAKPENPVKTANIVLPAEEFKPAEGVPVLDLTPGAVPAQWIYAGPLPRKSRSDVLGAIGGYSRARPKVGTEVRSGVMVGEKLEMSSMTFKKLGDDMMKDGSIDLAKIAPDGGPATVAFHTVLQVKQNQTVSLVKNSNDTRVWLNESELAAGSYYSLRPGLYPVIVVHATDKAGGVLTPKLEATDSPQGAEGMELHKLETAVCEGYSAQCQRSGASTLIAQTADLAWLRMHQHYRLGIGDGGFQAETGVYAMIASWYPLVYASVYPNVFGRSATGWPDVTHLMVRRMMQVLFREDGGTMVQKLNSVVGFDTGWVAMSFKIIPDQYKPALLWAWNKVSGVTDAGSVGNIINDKSLNGLAVAAAFLHYPLEMTPVHPAKSMPLMWHASTFGHFTFRSGWEGKDEFIGQAFVKSSHINGWSHPNTGTFRMLGLGHEWVVGSTNRVGFRDHEPCVRLPNDDINQGACGRVAYLKTERNGSAVLTIDMKDVYGSASGRLYDGNLLRLEKAFVDSGVTGLRALAFDYSGASGAPAVLAIVDKINGGKERAWQWSLPSGAAGRVKATDKGFVLDYGDASMNLTFIAPSSVKLHVGADRVALGKLGDKHRSYEGVIERVTTTGPADFFVVATFQRGAAPAVKVEGPGLDATVKIGEQTVRFDGQKIILGK